MSVAGFRPGFGRGGITHSLLVSDGGLDEASAAGEVVEVGVDEGWSDPDGKGDGIGAAGARKGVDIAAIKDVTRLGTE